MIKMEEKRDLSLYVHIPFCKAKCFYCDFISFGGCGYDIQKQYVKALCKEIEAYKEIADGYRIQTVFIGGGTPSYMEGSFIEQIMQTIYQVFEVEKEAEITIEGNPDSLTQEKLLLYRKNGINRLSIGLQSANDSMLKTLGRVHNYDQFIAAYNSARKAGFNNINIDVMSGLPGENMDSYIRTLGKVVDLAPEHISAYSLIVEEGTPLSENEELLDLLPAEEEDRRFYAKTKMLLKNSGYNRYEISNYAKEGFLCRHNLSYWTGGEYLGVGLNASSYLTVWTSDDTYKRLRFRGIDNLNEYIGRFSRCEGMREDDYTNMYSFYESDDDSNVEYADNRLLEFIRDYYKDLQFLKRKDEIEEFAFLGLRCMKGISKKEFKQRFGVEIEKVYEAVINKNKDRNLLIVQGDYIFLSEKGIDVSNMVMADFML